MVAAVSYASLTDPQLLGLAPTYAILLVLIIPCLYFITLVSYQLTRKKLFAQIHFRLGKDWHPWKCQDFGANYLDRNGRKEVTNPLYVINFRFSQQAPENEMQSVENTKKGKGAVFPKAKDGSRWTVIRVSIILKSVENSIQTLLKYMIPLFAVYFAEYFINQGLVSPIFLFHSTLSYR